MHRPKAKTLALAALLTTGAAWLAGGADALAEVRRQTQPQASSSGAMRSERVLLDIKAVLVRIDARLAGIEKQVAGLKTLAASRQDARGTGGLDVR